MVKPHSKLIYIYILVTLFVISTVLFLNSCGQNNPTGVSSATNTKPANANPSAFSSFAPGPKLTPLPAWMMNLPSASIADLLKAPNANPNAIGTGVRFDSLCGSYYEFAHFHRGPETGWVDHDTGGRKWILDNSPTMYMINFYVISNTPTAYECWGRYNPSSAGLQPNPPLRYYFLDCTLFPPGTMLPSDFFTGNGFPAGKYIGGDGSIYDFTPGTPPTVTPPDPNKPRTLLGVIITPDTASISVGEVTTFTGMAIYSKPPVVEPVTNAINSQNPNAATIANGTLTGINEGHTDLTLTLGGFMAWSYVDVALGAPNSVVIEPASATMLVGDKYSFKAFAVYSGNKRVDVSSRYETTWSIDTAVATIAGGVVTAVASGSTPISATFKGVTGTATVSVVDIPPVPDSVQITPLNASIAQGESQQYKATAIYNILPQYKPDITNDPNTTWTAGYPAVAELNTASKGYAKGIAPGKSYIWCTYKGVPSTTAAMLEVAEPKMFVDVSYSIFAWPGQIRNWDRYTLKTIVSYSDKSIPPVDVTQWYTTYKIDKPGVFQSVNPLPSYPYVGWELWAAAASGSATITATVTTTSGRTASGSVLLTINVNGNNPPPGGQCRNYVRYAQNVGTWKDQPYDGYTADQLGFDITVNPWVAVPDEYGLKKHSLGQAGCYTTVMAMALSTTGTPVDPGELDNWLKRTDVNGYDTVKHTIKVEKAILYTGSKIKSVSGWKSPNMDNIKQELDNCNLIIASVVGKNGGFADGHYVLIGKIENGKYWMYDSWQRASNPNLDLEDLSTVFYWNEGYKVLSTK